MWLNAVSKSIGSCQPARTTQGRNFSDYRFTPEKRMFSGVYWNQPVCPSVCVSVRVSVCVQNTSFCQTAGGGIKPHLVTALVFFFVSNFLCIRGKSYIKIHSIIGQQTIFLNL